MGKRPIKQEQMTIRYKEKMKEVIEYGQRFFKQLRIACCIVHFVNHHWSVLSLLKDTEKAHIFSTNVANAHSNLGIAS
ncbi:MAG: hypothetical protein ACQEWV_16225 [Bacillota bacterium]